MGGMVTSILASEYRSELPTDIQFRYLVTSPNVKSLPAVPDSLLLEWKQKADIFQGYDYYREILTPFFSKKFISQNPHTVDSYFQYRAIGENGQTQKAFMRQLTALRNFDGKQYFSNIDPKESTFIGGNDDYILGPKHNEELRRLVSNAKHLNVESLGHMINLEAPQYFNLKLNFEHER